MHPKYTVMYYDLNRSLLITLYASHTIIGAPVDRSRYLTHGRVCPPYVQHLEMHPKYTVVYYDLNRSLLITLYASHTIIGAPVDRSRYLVQHPRPCFAHRPDYSSAFTKGLGLTQYNRSINIRLIYDCMIPFYITRYDILYLAVMRIH